MLTQPEEEAHRFSEFLKIIKKEDNKSQKVIAKELSTQESYITKYKTGFLRIPSEIIVFLHERYDLSFVWFYTGKGRKRISRNDKAELITDVGELKAMIHVTAAKLDSYIEKTDRLVRDFYAYKNKV